FPILLRSEIPHPHTKCDAESAPTSSRRQSQADLLSASRHIRYRSTIGSYQAFLSDTHRLIDRPQAQTRTTLPEPALPQQAHLRSAFSSVSPSSPSLSSSISTSSAPAARSSISSSSATCRPSSTSTQSTSSTSED